MKSVGEQSSNHQQDFEKKYRDLFSSYTILLGHNKTLSGKLEVIERERDELLQRSLDTMGSQITEATKDASKTKHFYMIPDSFHNGSKQRKDNRSKVTISSIHEPEKSSRFEKRSTSISSFPLRTSSPSQKKKPMLIEELKEVKS